MKPRGLKDLLSRQSSLSAPTPAQDPGAMRLGALGGPNTGGDDKPTQAKTTAQKPAKGAKAASTAAKSSAATVRRTAPGA